MKKIMSLEFLFAKVLPFLCQKAYTSFFTLFNRNVSTNCFKQSSTNLLLPIMKMETMRDFIFLASKITADGDCSHEIERHLLLGRKSMTNLDSVLKSRHYFADKGPYSQSYGFSRSYVWMWELDYKESWVLKNWCFWTGVGEDSWESLGV